MTKPKSSGAADQVACAGGEDLDARLSRPQVCRGDRPRFPRFGPYSYEHRTSPGPMIAEIHRSAPVFFDPDLNAWIISKYDDVAETLRNSDAFSSATTRAIVPIPEELKEQVPDLAQGESVLSMDPPEHTAVRAHLQRALSKRIVESVRPVAERVAERLIDGFIDHGRCDFMQDFAYPFSGEVIVTLLGVPADRAADYQRWLANQGALLGPPGAEVFAERRGMTAAEICARWREMAEFNDFFRAFVLQHVDNPRDDLITEMLNIRDEEGKPAFDIGEVVRSVIVLLAGGHDTTANLIANMVILFTQHPDQHDALKADMSLLPGAIEEGLRFLGSATLLPRLTTRDVEVRGVKIPSGSLVCVLLQGANYDDEKFDRPLRFDIRRQNARKHLDFGYGRHACVGQPLARMEAEVALSTLYRRLPNLKADLSLPRSFTRSWTLSKLQSLQAFW
jgi:cytochrome P450